MTGSMMLKCAVATFAIAVGAVSADGWKAGTARVVITPTEPLWMAGYASRTKPAEGKIHDLWIRALALEDSQGRRCVILSCDLVGISRQVWDHIREQVGDLVERDALMINSSHTHSGPVTSRTLTDAYPLDDAQRALIDGYTKDFEQKAAAVIRESLSKLAPAKLSAGSGTATFAVNRRANPEPEVPALREKNALKGPVDHSVPVLVIRHPDGELLCVVFAYACHNTTLSSYQWCGDYAGFAQDAIENHHPSAQAMFVMGCGGDQNPIPRRELALAQRYGDELAAAVESVMARPMKELAPKLSTRLEFVDAPLGEEPSTEELEALASKDPDYAQRWAARLLADRAAGVTPPQSYAVPVQVWRLDQQVWIALGGEAVVDYSLKFKSAFGEETWVTSYANDVMAYIPSKRVLLEGGYEGGGSMIPYGMPAYRWGENVEDLITASVERLLAVPELAAQP